MSSGSESDDDYVPEDNPQKLSEEESADDETDQQYDNEVEQKKKKRKSTNPDSKSKKKIKICNPPEEEVEKPEEAEDQKKKEDDLWAMFLDGTDTKPKPKEPSKSIEPPKPENNMKKVNDAKKDETSEREKRIFEFAGETIVVENNVIKERIKNDDIPGSAPKAIARPSAGGISGLLGQINKKNKLSTLEKSKLDWMTYKKVEGLEEEIQSHNKGKQGYLERRDFLERADYRQYEIERDLRMSKRSKR